MGKSFLVMALRWTAVLPGAILFTLLVDFPIHWIVLLKSYNPEEPNLFGFITVPPETLEYLAYALFNPMLAILAAAYIAPLKKFATAVTMSIFSLCSIVFCYSYYYVSSIESMGLAGVCLRLILNIAGLAIALVIIYQKSDSWYVKNNHTDRSTKNEQSQIPTTLQHEFSSK